MPFWSPGRTSFVPLFCHRKSTMRQSATTMTHLHLTFSSVGFGFYNLGVSLWGRAAEIDKGSEMVAGASCWGAIPTRVCSTPGTVLCSTSWLCNMSPWGSVSGHLVAMPHTGWSPPPELTPCGSHAEPCLYQGKIHQAFLLW